MQFDKPLINKFSAAVKHANNLVDTVLCCAQKGVFSVSEFSAPEFDCGIVAAAD